MNLKEKPITKVLKKKDHVNSMHRNERQFSNIIFTEVT